MLRISLLGPLAWLVVGGLLAVPVPAPAQQAVGVSPPRFEWTLSPGGVQAGRVVLFTSGTNEVRVTPAVLDWVLRPNGAVVVMPPGSHPYSAADWITLAQEPFGLEPGRRLELDFSVRVPPDAEGSYWAALSFTSAPSKVEQGGITYQVKVRALSMVYVTVAGTEKPGAEVQGFVVDQGALLLEVANTGNTYLRLKGLVKVRDERGEVIHEGELGEKVLLRDGLIRYRIPLPEEAWEKGVLAAVELGASRPVPLPYTLYAELPLR